MRILLACETTDMRPSHRDLVRRTVPLDIVTGAADDKPIINKILLEEREKFIPLDTSKPFKVNADTTGFCMRSIYPDLRTISRSYCLPWQMPSSTAQSDSPRWASRQRLPAPRSRFRTASGSSGTPSRLRKLDTRLSAAPSH